MDGWMDGWMDEQMNGWVEGWVGGDVKVYVSSSACVLWWEIFLRPANSKAKPKVWEVKWGLLKSISLNAEERKPMKLHHANASQSRNFVFFLESQHQGYLRSGCGMCNAWATCHVLERWHWGKNSADLAQNPWAGGALRKDMRLCASEMWRIIVSEAGGDALAEAPTRTVKGDELRFHSTDEEIKAHRDQGIWLASGPDPSLDKCHVL